MTPGTDALPALPAPSLSHYRRFTLFAQNLHARIACAKELRAEAAWRPRPSDKDDRPGRAPVH
jgi:hypothetical protein